MKVAILCASPRSIYKTFNDVEVFDKFRDARTFDGTIPVVAHPPCRAWSAFCRHQAKPEDGEKELGPLCVAHLIRCGGVLEHPAYSRLFDECNLPKPGERRGGFGRRRFFNHGGDGLRLRSGHGFASAESIPVRSSSLSHSATSGRVTSIDGNCSAKFNARPRLLSSLSGWSMWQGK